MYRNLEAELRRKGITRKMLAAELGLNISTVSAKLTGKSPLLWGEVEIIVSKVFQDEFDIKYLFQYDKKQI